MPSWREGRGQLRSGQSDCSATPYTVWLKSHWSIAPSNLFIYYKNNVHLRGCTTTQGWASPDATALLVGGPQSLTPVPKRFSAMSEWLGSDKMTRYDWDSLFQETDNHCCCSHHCFLFPWEQDHPCSQGQTAPLGQHHYPTSSWRKGRQRPDSYGAEKRSEPDWHLVSLVTHSQQLLKKPRASRTRFTRSKALVTLD